jgi:transcription antitermination factor NusG
MVKGERLRQKLEAREAAAKLRAARARRDRDAREAADKRKKDAGLGAGDLARVIAGPMRGCDLRVVEVTGTSVRGLIELLGGDVSVEVRADMVAARKGGVDAP